MGHDLLEDTRTEKEKKQVERQERMRAAAEEEGHSYEVAMAAEEDLDDGLWVRRCDYNMAEEEAETELWVGQMDEWKDMDRNVFDMMPTNQRATPEQ